MDYFNDYRVVCSIVGKKTYIVVEDLYSEDLLYYDSITEFLKYFPSWQTPDKLKKLQKMLDGVRPVGRCPRSAEEGRPGKAAHSKIKKK